MESSVLKLQIELEKRVGPLEVTVRSHDLSIGELKALIEILRKEAVPMWRFRLLERGFWLVLVFAAGVGGDLLRQAVGL